VTRAEELAERVRPWTGGAQEADAALSELVADAEALAEALERLHALVDDESYGDRPITYSTAWVEAHNLAEAALARYRGEK
jgi:hypothetical protein